MKLFLSVKLAYQKDWIISLIINTEQNNSSPKVYEEKGKETEKICVAERKGKPIEKTKEEKIERKKK